MPVDDHMSLPIGTEFDFVIKAKAEEIDAQKEANNQKMDELVEKLGYMDYRDALACNRYIMEAKRSRDYHQAIRGRLLEVAFLRMNKDKRIALQRESRKEAKATDGQADDISLKKLMAEDAELAQMYQEDFAAEKLNQESDVQRVDDVHERFDYFKDDKRMANKKKDPRFDLIGELPDTEDELFSSDNDMDQMTPQDAELY